MHLADSGQSSNSGSAILRILLALEILWSSPPGIVSAADGVSIVEDVTSRFHASKPTVVMKYEATYVLLSIHLMRVADATLKATEGFWRKGPSNDWIPACLIDFHVASSRGGGENEDGGVRLFKRTVSVLTLPELRIITYAKQNDESIKPFFRKASRMKYEEVYNFESGGVSYRRYDQVSGVVETNLPGLADLARQSTEVAEVLWTLHAAYRGQPAERFAMADRVHFNVDGAVRTFRLEMKKGRTTVPVLSRKVAALYADIRPDNDRENRRESFSMWCMPFRDFSAAMGDSELQAIAETSLECSMLPLSGEYSLFLGSIQCALTNICAQGGSQTLRSGAGSP